MPGPGVKGRPQACLTCRRRKKGCDLRRPSCSQCRKACIPCAGYTHDLPKQPVADSSTPEPAAAPAAASTTTTWADSSHPDTHGSPAQVSTTWSAELPLPLARDDFTPGTTAPGVYYPAPVSSVGHYASSSTTSMPSTLPLYPSTSLPPEPQPPYSDELPWDTYQTQPSETSTLPSTPRPSWRASNDTSSTALGRHQQKLRSRLIQHHHHSVDPLHSGPLAVAATADNLISHFWSAYLPNSQPFPNSAFHITFGSSLPAVQAHLQSNSGLRHALLALGLTAVGQAHASKPMLEQGFRTYSDALQQVARGLRHARAYSEEQLVATRLFGLYEALFGTELQSHAESARSWMLHSSGEAAILTANPPEAYIRGSAHSLFVAGRHHMALSALMHRKKTFLSEPVWKTVPWLENPKSSRDWLLDIMVDIPSVIEGIELMKTWQDPHKRESYRRVLCRATEDIMDRLVKWHKIHAVPITPATLAEPLPPRLEPGMLANSHVMTLYHSTSIRMHNMHRSLAAAGSKPSDRLDAAECCRQLVRGVRIFAHPDAGLFRLHIAPYPMSTAMQYVNGVAADDMAEERLALWDVLNSRECFPVLQFILSMEPLQVRSLKPPDAGQARE